MYPKWQRQVVSTIGVWCRFQKWPLSLLTHIGEWYVQITQIQERMIKKAMTNFLQAQYRAKHFAYLIDVSVVQMQSWDNKKEKWLARVTT